MTAGSRQIDPATNVTIFEAARGGVGKLLGTFTVTDQAGSFSDARLRSGVPFVMPASGLTGYFNRAPSRCSFGDGVINWGNMPYNSDGQAMGGSGLYYYGVGPANNPNYQSTHVAGTAGFRVNDDSGNFVIDETFFAYQLVNKTFVSNPNSGPVTFPSDYMGMLFAIRSGDYVNIVNMTTNSNGTTSVLFSGGSFTIYFFSKIGNVASTGTIGNRWWSNSGELLGDTSVPFMNVTLASQVFSGSRWDEGYEYNVPGLASGRQYAVMYNASGMRVKKTGVLNGQGVQGNVTIFRMSGRVVTSNGSDLVYVSGRQVVSQPAGGGNDYDNRFDGMYSIVDVTGL